MQFALGCWSCAHAIRSSDAPWAFSPQLHLWQYPCLPRSRPPPNRNDFAPLVETPHAYHASTVQKSNRRCWAVCCGACSVRATFIPPTVTSSVYVRAPPISARYLSFISTPRLITRGSGAPIYTYPAETGIRARLKTLRVYSGGPGIERGNDGEGEQGFYLLSA
jgi:hypothetical protein